MYEQENMKLIFGWEKIRTILKSETLSQRKQKQKEEIILNIILKLKERQL